ncbi:MAG: SH3 domain-containing protein [bacterium]|jgi:uncharacterized protein YgiM (DUF1202 family)
MHRFTAAWLLAAFAASAISLFPQGSSLHAQEQEAEARIYFTVADSGANVRSGPSSSYEVLTAFEPGVLVYKVRTEKSWILVATVSEENRIEGWVWSKLLVPSSGPNGDGVQAESDGQPAEEGDSGKPDTTDKPAESENAKPSAESPANAIVVKQGSEPAPASPQKPEKDSGKFDSFTTAAVEGSDLIALITAENVNLRAKPNLRSDVIGSVTTGEKVYIVEERKPWYFVSIPGQGKRGWVFGDFVKQLDYVVITGDDVNLREKPSESAKVIRKLPKGLRFVKKSWLNNYVLVASPDKGYTGWVHQRYVRIDKAQEAPTYVVSGDSINFRKDPSITADVLDQLDAGVKVKVLGREEKWTLVKYNGKTGWMYSEYLKSEADFLKQGGLRGVKRSLGADLINRALSLRGTPYRWSGESPGGFDCSGFIYYLIQTATGVNDLPRSAADMYRDLGVSVDKEDLRPGDLVFFTTYKAGASHVGLYLGDGDFVHASSAQGEVTISNMSEGYYKERFIGAKRVGKK